jgi:hypothetical protein
MYIELTYTCYNLLYIYICIELTYTRYNLYIYIRHRACSAVACLVLCLLCQVLFSSYKGGPAKSGNLKCAYFSRVSNIGIRKCHKHRVPRRTAGRSICPPAMDPHPKRPMFRSFSASEILSELYIIFS